MLMTGATATALPSALTPVTGVAAPSVLQPASVESSRTSQTDTTYTKIFVGGLPYHTTDKSLREHFEVYGEIEEAVVITDRQTGKSRGYGFVTMADRSGADRATKDPNPAIDGRKANVNLAYIGAKPRGPASSSGYAAALSPAAALRVYPHMSAGTPYGITAPTSYLGYQQILQPAGFPFIPAHHQLGHTAATPGYTPTDFSSAAAAYLGQYHAAAAAADPYAAASAALSPYSYGAALPQVQASVAGAATGTIPLAYTAAAAAPQAQLQEARLQ